MITENLKYCKNCIYAKPKENREPPLWYCGKHRLYITSKTCYSYYKEKECEHYTER